MDGYPRGLGGGGGTRWGYRPGASPTDWPKERGRNFDPCGNFFHGFLYPHCAPVGRNTTQGAGKGLSIPRSQNRALGHPVNSTGTRRMTEDLLDECIGLFSRTETQLLDSYDAAESQSDRVATHIPASLRKYQSCGTMQPCQHNRAAIKLIRIP